MNRQTIAIVAGEQSGDELGAAVMSALLERNPDIEFFGVGGDKMIALGLRSLFEQERLAVMGFVEPFKRLPDLLNAKKRVVTECLELRPDLFLGIDSPDFNLRISKALNKHKIKTAHYVSPSVWAWRQGRIKGIRKSIDLMLTLFPFEEAFYKEHQVRALCVGHPLADSLPIEMATNTELQRMRSNLNLPMDSPIVTLMPGSRGGEVRMMGELFLGVAHACLKHTPNLHFIVPAANSDRMTQLSGMLAERGDTIQGRVHLIKQQSHQAMQVSDAVLLASGTSTLEAMLLKKPMIVAYRLSSVTYAIVKHMVKTPYISLPNLIADEMLVPEFIQDDATVESLSQAVLTQLNETHQKTIQDRFTTMHRDLRLNSAALAADALLSLINNTP
ncbi:MAG: lipid-A-disaccharide synthase [Pseudomonadota bacterium]